jgi:hypothetical protein
MGRASEMGWAFLIGLVTAFVLFFMLVAEPPALSPVEAYCRGAVDGRTSAIKQVQVYNPSEEELDGYEAQCVKDTADDDLLPGARGPIVPEYE